MNLNLHKRKSLKLRVPSTNKKLILPSVNLPLGNRTLTIGFDTEFKQVSEGHNNVLSYQYYAEWGSPGSVDYKHWEGILFTYDDDRMKLTDFIHWVISDGINEFNLDSLPGKVFMVCHFSVVDVSLFADFNDFKNQIDNVRRTFVSIKNGIRLYAHNEEKNPDTRFNLFFRDTFVLAPLGFKSLKALGDLVGLPKLEIKRDEIENMDVFRKKDPDQFIQYALRDAVICVKYVNEIRRIYSDLGLSRRSPNQEPDDFTDTPVTLTSIGVDYLLNIWEQRDINSGNVLGVARHRARRYNRIVGQYYYKWINTLHENRNIGEQFAVETYHGGRSETYLFGASSKGKWVDYDLCGAYTTAMASIGVPLWDQLHQTTDIGELTDLNNLSFCLCEFKFPKSVKYPSMPVRTEYGLIFPREGKSYCCGPELILARKLKAKIEIKFGYVLPMDTKTYPYLEFVRECRKHRNKYEKETLENMFWKEIGNSTYGKTAQGLRKKNVFDTRSGETETLKASKITNPFIASQITSLVRAVVSEQLNKLPDDVEVCNVTTDGFLSTLPPEKLKSITNGTLSRHFGKFAKEVTGTPGVLEIKHEARQVMGWRTRGQLTVESEGEKPIILAKGGIKAPTAVKEEANEWILTQFLNRTPDTKYTVEYIRSIRSIYGDEYDATTITLNRRLSMEYDWKRKPLPESACLRKMRGINHLYFDTEAWDNIDDYIKCREQWESYRNNDGVGVLKTIQDFTDWWSFYRFSSQNIKMNKPVKETEDMLFVRVLSRCFAFGQFGFESEHKVMKASEFCSLVKQHKLPIKTHHVYNATTGKVNQIEKLPKFSPKKKFLKVLEELKTPFPKIKVSDYIEAS